MANVFNLIFFYNFFFFVFVKSFKLGKEDISSFFLRSPYLIAFGKNPAPGEVSEEFNVKNPIESSEEDAPIEELKLYRHLDEIENKNEIKIGEVQKEVEKEKGEDNIVGIMEKEVEVEENEDSKVGIVEKEVEVVDDETNKKNENYIDKKDKLPSTFLLPGLGGSTLIVEYRNAYIPTCSRNNLNSKPFRLWLSLSRLLSIKSNIYCTFDTIKLSYDEKKNKYSNREGVIVKLEKHGYVKGVNYLDYFHNNGIHGTGYYSTISNYFLENKYVDSESLVGFPYDWRLPLHQQNYDLLKKHIEYIYERRNKNKINLIGHSMGGLLINFFLTHIVNKKWKKKYLNAIFYINSPFKGSFKTIRTLLYGEGNSISFSFAKMAKLSISDGMMKALGRAIGSIYDLIPYAQYYNHNQVVVLINLDKNPIDVDKMKQLVDLCGLYDIECYSNRSDVNLKVYTLSNWFELVDPVLRVRIEKNVPYIDRKYSMDHGVPIYCLYSTTTKKETMQLLFFQSTDLNKEPYVYYGNGDGTVPLESLEACKDFYNAKEVKCFNTNHCGILHDHEVSQYLYSVASENQN